MDETGVRNRFLDKSDWIYRFELVEKVWQSQHGVGRVSLPKRHHIRLLRIGCLCLLEEKMIISESDFSEVVLYVDIQYSDISFCVHINPHNQKTQAIRPTSYVAPGPAKSRIIVSLDCKSAKCGTSRLSDSNLRLYQNVL